MACCINNYEFIRTAGVRVYDRRQIYAYKPGATMLFMRKYI